WPQETPTSGPATSDLSPPAVEQQFLLMRQAEGGLAEHGPTAQQRTLLRRTMNADRARSLGGTPGVRIPLHGGLPLRVVAAAVVVLACVGLPAAMVRSPVLWRYVIIALGGLAWLVLVLRWPHFGVMTLIATD